MIDLAAPAQRVTIYQGRTRKPGAGAKYLRATLPLPTGGPGERQHPAQGRNLLLPPHTTLAWRSSSDAAAYTRAGLDVVFRPSDKKIEKGKANAQTKGFFDMKKYATEEERRSDLSKWETVLHGSKRKAGQQPGQPCL